MRPKKGVTIKHSLEFIKEKRPLITNDSQRILGDKFILVNVLMKKITVYPVYILLNIGVKADYVTILSFLFIFVGAFFAYTQNFLYAAISWMSFLFLDSIDGDLARCQKPTVYGATFDSFGADLFYSIYPISIGYYLFQKSTVGLNGNWFVIGGLCSMFFVLARLFRSKKAYLMTQISKNNKTIKEKGMGLKKKYEKKKAFGLVKAYRNEIIRGNFFSEPGIIFNTILLAALNLSDVYLGYYLISIAIYNLGYFALEFAETYFTFIKINKSLSEQA